jgi:hypothetical protein
MPPSHATPFGGWAYVGPVELRYDVALAGNVCVPGAETCVNVFTPSVFFSAHAPPVAPVPSLMVTVGALV